MSYIISNFIRLENMVNIIFLLLLLLCMYGLDHPQFGTHMIL